MLARRAASALRRPLRPLRRRPARARAFGGQDYWRLLQEGHSADKDHRAMAAWRAVRGALGDEGDVCDDLLLQPDELTELLDSIACCPAFSEELYQSKGPLCKHVFCSEDAFEGCAHRRKYFRNQMLRLHFEKSLHISQALRSLDDSEARDDLAFEGILSCAQPEDRPLDEASDGASRKKRPHEDGGRRADFLVDSQTTEFLSACHKGDLFLARHIPEGTGDQLHLDARAEHVQWFVGIAQEIKAPAGSLVNLLQLHLYPIGPQTGADADASHGDTYEIVPIGFLPTVFKRQRAAVMDICESDPRFTEFVQRLVFPLHQPCSPHDGIGACTQERDQMSQISTSSDTAQRFNSRVGLNSQQCLAVEAAAGGEPVTLIQGPPGTGKSAVAVAIVEAWLEQDSKTPILVATGTHSSKNLIACRLQERGIVISQRRDVVLKRKPPPGSVPVFVETVYMAASPSERELPRVIIDESSQITEAAALVAIGQGCNKLVLIGDPRQLGPVSNIGKVLGSECAPFTLECASVYELMRSRHGLQPVILKEQYRMSRLLCDYPSKRFYDGELVTAAVMEDAQLPQCLSPFALFKETSVDGGSKPTIFVDTVELDGRWEEIVSLHGARSLRNTLEARIVAHIVQGLEGNDLRSEDISLLTGYSAQRDYLAHAVHGTSLAQGGRRWKQRAAKRLLHGVDPLEEEPHPRAHTVDGFQGSESDLVVFSAVRSSPGGGTGFAGEPRRLCVLLTRARRALIVVGDSSTLKNDEEWRAWLEEAPMQTVRLTPRSLEDVLQPGG